MVTTVAPVHLAAFRDIARHRPREGRDLRGAGARRRAILPTATPTDLPADPARRRRRAGARPVRFGATGRPSSGWSRSAVARDGTCVAGARARGAPSSTGSRAPGRHLADERARRARRGRRARRRPRRAPRWRSAHWQAAGGARRALTIAPRPGRARRRDHADRRKLQRQPRRDGRRARGARRRAARDGIGRVARGRRIAFLGDMLELGPRRGARCTPASPRHPALAAIDRRPLRRPAHARALHAALPAGQRGEMVPRPPPSDGRPRRPPGRRRRRRPGQGLARLAGRPGG